MAHISPLVPDIQPLLQSLQQFTPQARQNRQFQLAGLEQQQALGDLELQQAQTAQRQAQMQALIRENKTNLLDDIADLDFVLGGKQEGLRNRLGKLAAEKDPGSPDLAELADFANRVVQSPEEAIKAFQELTLNRERAKGQLNAINQIEGRMAATKFQKTASFLVRNDDGSTALVTGVFDPSTGGLTTETATFRADQLVSRLGETPEEITTRSVEEAERVAEAEAGVELVTAPPIASAVETARGQAKISTDIVKKGNDSVQKINKNLLNLDRALAALGRGAGVGAVERFLPSVKAASVELDQIRNELALDVIGSVTFGALSQGELDLALRTAIPTGLNTKELTDFLQRKKVAQEKLRDYFIEQIKFLSKPGATVAEFMESKQPGQFQPVPAGDTPEGTIASSPDGTRIIVRNGTWVLQ